MLPYARLRLKNAQYANWWSPLPGISSWMITSSLPAIYAGAGITTRHLAFEPQLVDDVLHGAGRSGSVFLPTGAEGDHGPTTAQRMEHYALHAAPLALLVKSPLPAPRFSDQIVDTSR